MTFQVTEKPKTFEAIKVANDNLPHVARMFSDSCTTDQVRKYIGAYVVKKGIDIHICCEEDFHRFYQPVCNEVTAVSEIISILEWAQQNLGKHTRPSPIDKLLAKFK